MKNLTLILSAIIAFSTASFAQFNQPSGNSNFQPSGNSLGRPIVRPYVFDFKTVVDSFSANGSTKVFSVSTGLPYASTNYFIVPMTDSASGAYFLSAVVGTIRVNYHTAPAAGTKNVVIKAYYQ